MVPMPRATVAALTAILSETGRDGKEHEHDDASTNELAFDSDVGAPLGKNLELVLNVLMTVCAAACCDCFRM